jgi:serine/threonine-protein kinase
VSLERDRVEAALPGYEIGGELGRGGWGVVLEGRHRQLQREVAIKQLPAAFASDPTVRARFVAEARVLASLDHPHVVPVFDYVENEDVCLLVMEKLPGGTVWKEFSTTGLTMPSVCAIVMAACAGLNAAHAKGILHRDVKPENLMFSATRTLKVTDFGIAKVLAGSETKATRAGEILGTPAYMAPEQVLNKQLTPATDVYAVGMMLYELLSGRLPFSQEDAMALLFCQLNDIPTPLREVAPSVPPKLAAVTMRSLEKDPTARYATTEDLGVALGEAATEAWDPGWLQQSNVAVMATGRMAAVTTQAQGLADTGAPPGVSTAGGGGASAATVRPSAATAVPGASGAPATVLPGAPPTVLPGAPPTVLPGAPPAAAASGAGATVIPGTTGTPGSPGGPAGAGSSGAPAPGGPSSGAESAPASAPPRRSAAPSQVVRSQEPAERARGAVAADLSADDLVGIEEVVKIPPVPTVQMVAAGALFLVCLALAFIGLGKSPAKAGTIPPGSVKVANVDPSAGQVVPVNLAQPVPVAGTLPPAAHGANNVQLAFSVAGVPLGKVSAPLTATPTGQFTASLSSTNARYLVASQTPTKLQFLNGSQVLAEDTFLLRSHQSALLSVPGAFAIAALLFCAAYLESLLRALRRAPNRWTRFLGLVIMGGLLGVAAVIWGWLIASTQPTTTALVVCAVVGAAAGVSAGLAAVRFGQRRRFRTGRPRGGGVVPGR